MAADGDATSRGVSLLGRLRRLVPRSLQAGAGALKQRCAVCCGYAICLRCGGRGQVLVVPMGWEARPYIEDCPDCEGTGACVECGAAALN